MKSADWMWNAISRLFSPSSSTPSSSEGGTTKGGIGGGGDLLLCAVDGEEDIQASSSVKSDSEFSSYNSYSGSVSSASFSAVGGCDRTSAGDIKARGGGNVGDIKIVQKRDVDVFKTMDHRNIGETERRVAKGNKGCAAQNYNEQRSYQGHDTYGEVHSDAAETRLVS